MAKDLDENKVIFANNLEKYLNIKRMTQTDLSKTLNIPEMTVSNWMNAKTYPRVDKIQLLADFFGIQKSDLTEAKTENNQIDEKAMRIAAHIDDDVTEEQMNDIIKYIEFLKSQQQKE